MKKIIYFGLLAGLINIIGWVVLDAIFQGENFDFSLGETLGYSAMLIALSTVFFGVKSYRDKELNGNITFKNAFIKGLIIVSIASLIYVIGWEIYYPNFQADFGEKYSAYLISNLEESGSSAAEIEAEKANMIEWMEMYQNPLYRVPMTLMEIFPLGLIVAVISALILKRK
jgi:amino acid transporter